MCVHMYKIYNSNKLNNCKRSLLQKTASLGDEKRWVLAAAALFPSVKWVGKATR